MRFQVSNKDFETNLNRLDDSQSAAVTSDADHVVIRAAAGSGKTSTLITAIANYRYEHINDRICAITYTRAARAEMETRLRNMGIYDVEVSTIHVWSRNMLDYFANKYDFKIKILEEPHIKSILREIVKEYLIRSRIKSINIDILYTYITGSKTMDITDNYRRTLNALEERYILYKRNNGLYDFTDYPQYLWDVMSAYDEYINTIDALFVDEFQDVDSVQCEIFEKVNANKKFFIGDPWQSIFQFRGADGEVFNKLDNFELFKLKYNYRSFQEIIDYATHVYSSLKSFVLADRDCYITQVDETNMSRVMCERGYGGHVCVVTPHGRCFVFEDGERSSANAMTEIREMLERKPMILCRTNKQVRATQELGYTNVSTVHQAKGLEYDNVIVIDHTISSDEDLNIAYVALTRAKDKMLVINWSQFENYLKHGAKVF